MIELKATKDGFMYGEEQEESVAEFVKYIYTPQEHKLGFSSADPSLLQGQGDLFVPIGILCGKLTPEEVIQERLRRAYFCVPHINIFEEKFLALKLALLDPNTHQTIHDPRLFAEFDYEENSLHYGLNSRLPELLRKRYEDSFITVGDINYPVFRN